MLVRIEIEFGDTVLSITQEDILSYSGLDVCSGAAVLSMARCAGRMIAALGAGSSMSAEAMVEEFNRAVLRSARTAAPDTPHTCDGVACC